MADPGPVPSQQRKAVRRAIARLKQDHPIGTGHDQPAASTCPTLAALLR